MTSNALTGLQADGRGNDRAAATLKLEINRLVAIHGADAVKKAIEDRTKPKRGRKLENDWPALGPVYEHDAREWLEGRDPFSSRSNYSIARGVADANPGHSHPATMKRIQRKLSADRERNTLVQACFLSREGYPYAHHIRAIVALIDVDPHPGRVAALQSAKRNVADFETRMGEAPSANMSMKDIEDNALKGVRTIGSFAKSMSQRGLLGPWPNSTPTGDAKD